jgi:RimJ/RimL family protein N-acetyltransferase
VARGRLTALRPFEDFLTDSEIAQVYRWSRDTEILRWSGGTPTELTLVEFRDRLRRDRHLAPPDRLAFLIMTHRGDLIGRIGCFAIDWDRKQAELGIVIAESTYWGRGYGRDAVKTLLRHVFETTPIETVNLFTFSDNVRAQRCFTACGFRTLGNARRFSPDVGEFDGVEMEITRSEFLEQESRASAEMRLPPPGQKDG